jgi:transcriptional regulator of arginine metabolism
VSTTAQTVRPGPTVPATKAARHQLITDTLARHAVPSQSVLAEMLAAHGVVVSQGTLSRDLDELGAVRVRTSTGELVYALPGEGGDRTPRAGETPLALHERLSRIAAETLVSAAASANLVVLRTPPGAAQYLASAIDHTEMPAVLGSVAGDDTVLVVCADPSGGDALARAFLDMAASQRPTPDTAPPTTTSTDFAAQGAPL